MTTTRDARIRSGLVGGRSSEPSGDVVVDASSGFVESVGEVTVELLADGFEVDDDADDDEVVVVSADSAVVDELGLLSGDAGTVGSAA